MKAWIVAALVFIASPAYAGAELAAGFFGAGWPLNVTNTFLSGGTTGWQSWTHSGFSMLTTSDPTFAHSLTGYVLTAINTTGSLSKTVVTGAGDFSLWVMAWAALNASTTCTFSIDGGAPVSCKPSATSTWTQFNTPVTAGAHTLAVNVVNGATGNIHVDDIAYAHPQLPLWPASNTIGGSTAIGYQGASSAEGTGVTSSGTISVAASCSAGAHVNLIVDGTQRDTLVCTGTQTDTLTYAVTAGTHTVRVEGGGTDGEAWAADTFSVPIP